MRSVKDYAGFKTCTKCSQVLPVSSFTERPRKTGMSYCSHCKACRSKNTKSSYDTTKKAEYAYKRKYNVCRDTVYSVPSCEICGVLFSETIVRQQDHNHKTGAVRGVLCRPCNVGIGFLRDNTSVLENAIKYLRRYDEGNH